MAVFEITSPDGRTFEVTAPAGATKEQVLAYAQSQFAPQPSAQPVDRSIPTAGTTRRTQPMPTEPSISIPQAVVGAGETALSALTGVGAGAYGTAKGIAQSIARGQYGTPQGVKTAEEIAAQTMQERTYQPRTQAGQRFTEALGEFSQEAGLQGLMGMPVGRTAPLMPRAEAVSRQLTRKAQNVPRDAMIKEAQNIGLVAPPSQVGAGAGSRALETASGKYMLNQAASAKNSQVINDAARKYIGLPIDSPLTTETLADLKSTYSAPYERASALPPTQVQSTGAGMVRSTLTRSGAEIVNDIKIAKEDANAAFKALKNPNLPDRTETRNLYNQLTRKVKSLEQELDTLAKANKQPDLLTDLRDARQRLAKVYTVENALNPETGTVDIKSLSKQEAPISGELALAQRFAKAFPDVTKPVSVQPNPLSIYDLLAISAGAGGEQTNKLLIGLPLLRASGRAAVISQPFQRAMVTPKYPMPLGTSTIPMAGRTAPFIPALGLLNALPGTENE